MLAVPKSVKMTTDTSNALPSYVLAQYASPSSCRPGSRFCHVFTAAELNRADHESTAQDADGCVVLVQFLLHPDTQGGHEIAFQRPSTPANHNLLCTCIILSMYHSINVTHREKYPETNIVLMALSLPVTCSLSPYVL